MTRSCTGEASVNLLLMSTMRHSTTFPRTSGLFMAGSPFCNIARLNSHLFNSEVSDSLERGPTSAHPIPRPFIQCLCFLARFTTCLRARNVADGRSLILCFSAKLLQASSSPKCFFHSFSFLPSLLFETFSVHLHFIISHRVTGSRAI